MARSNLAAARVRPRTAGPVRLEVLRTSRVSPSFQRVTLGRGDVAEFRPMGFDQWFRLFLPLGDGTLEKLPEKMTVVSYLGWLAATRGSRATLRAYTVKNFRADGPDGPEIDVDFALHEPAGPATAFASSCAPGDQVALLDEGISFNPPDGTGDVLIVADESALPAVSGILASLPAGTRGTAIVEVPDPGDRQELTKPDGVELVWVVRAESHATPGTGALATLTSGAAPAATTYAWTAGEQSLATGVRRYLVAAGVPKQHITFVGYWRAGRSH